MRKFTAALILTTALVGSVYTYYWFKQSDELRKSLEQTITQLNEQMKQLSKDTTFIRYESIVTSGYPFSIQLDVNKPVIDVPVFALERNILRGQNLQPPLNNLTDVMVELSYSDKISLISNIMANKFSVIALGDSLIKPTVNNVARKAITGTYSAPFICNLEIANNDNMPWNILQSVTTPETFLTAFRSASCSISGTASKYSDSQEPLASMDDFNITVTNTPVNHENSRISVKSEIKNLKVSAAYDELSNSYMSIFYDISGVPQEQRATEMNLSKYGEQNSAIDVTYEGPLDKKEILEPSANIRLDINTLNDKNALYEANSEAHISSIVQEAERNSSVAIHSNVIVTEQYEQLLKQKLVKLFDFIAKNPESEEKFVQDIAKSAKPEELANAIMPKLHNAGKISFDADIKLKGDKDKNILLADSYNINALDLSTGQYGIKIKGNAKYGASTIPAGELLATCISCDSLINDIGDYSINLDSIIASTRAGNIHYVTKQLVDGIKQFMHAIDENSANKNSKDVTVHFVSDDKGKVTISGKQILEVIGLFGVNVGQNLQHIEDADKEQAARPAKVSPAQTAEPVKPAE